MISGENGKLRIGQIREQLGPDIQLQYLESVDSTNSWARREFANGTPDGTVYLADYQSAGRGRRGHSWESPEYTSVSMSLLLRPQTEPQNLPMLTLVMGMAAAEGMRRRGGVNAVIKWPNDVVCRGRKLCGILTELVQDPEAGQAVIIGIGMNVNVPVFPQELEDKATSLLLETGHSVSREQVTADVLQAFGAYYRIFRETGDMSVLISRYTELLATRDCEVRVLDQAGSYEGYALGVNAKGELLVRRKDSGTVEEVRAGEVSVRGMLGYA